MIKVCNINTSWDGLIPTSWPRNGHVCHFVHRRVLGRHSEGGVSRLPQGVRSLIRTNYFSKNSNITKWLCDRDYTSYINVMCHWGCWRGVLRGLTSMDIGLTGSISSEPVKLWCSNWRLPNKQDCRCHTWNVLKRVSPIVLCEWDFWSKFESKIYARAVRRFVLVGEVVACWFGHYSYQGFDYLNYIIYQARI